ncbi:hypothetical protein [Sphingomonas sp. GB1N7]|uniref:hypothetical protein n=1 Tax=Parasphingomonas caseinilytica TaxID=3096158 RepID=UPI003FA689D0
MDETASRRLNFDPISRIVNITVTAGNPVIMLEEPIPAICLALPKAGLALTDIDLFEVIEAIASIPMPWLEALYADPAKLNVNGGAIALGHPLGASGTKLMTTLLHALKATDARNGLQNDVRRWRHCKRHYLGTALNGGYAREMVAETLSRYHAIGRVTKPRTMMC